MALEVVSCSRLMCSEEIVETPREQCLHPWKTILPRLHGIDMTEET
jgi:hypothetical protein